MEGSIFWSKITKRKSWMIFFEDSFKNEGAHETSKEDGGFIYLAF